MFLGGVAAKSGIYRVQGLKRSYPEISSTDKCFDSEHFLEFYFLIPYNIHPNRRHSRLRWL